MTLWIDADAVPQPVKEICFRASERLALATILVANQRITLPAGYSHLSCVRVDSGPDVADQYIAERSVTGDVAVTQDIPLAALLVPKGVVVLDPRGDEYTPESIGEASVDSELHGWTSRERRRDRRSCRLRAARKTGIRKRTGSCAYARTSSALKLVTRRATRASDLRRAPARQACQAAA